MLLACSPIRWSLNTLYGRAGKFTVQYEEGEAVEINAGDFVQFPVGKTTFVVKENVRKFFTLG